jgi:hypothetical protein
MKTSFSKTTCLLVLLLAGVVAHAPAVAGASPIDVIRDCSEDGSLDRKYSQDDLSGALGQLPSDLDEYTDCRSVIRAAQLSGPRKHGKRAGASVVNKVDTKAPANRREQKELERATGAGDEVEIGGKSLKPGTTGAPLAAAGLGTDLPTLMLIVLAMLGLAMIGGALLAAQRRWPDEWQAAGARLGRLRDRVGRGISRRP